MTSIGKKLMMTTAAMFASGALYAAPASAQAIRTWVSGVGDDVNPCSRTAPCKTFAGAISKTAAGGEINCLDPGGFGTVTITKAMTIICDQVEGGVTAASVPGFTINAGVNDIVTISGIDLLGATTSPGTNGVNFVNGGGLNLRNTTIKGFGTQGINFQPQTGSAFLNVDNVKIIGSGTVGDSTTGGIRIAPSNGLTANVVITNTQVQGNVNVGLRLDLTGTTGTRINMQVANSTLGNSGIGLFVKAPTGSGTINAMVTSTVISGNGNTGVLGNGSGVTARFSNTAVTSNGSASAAAATGVSALNAASVLSYGNNQLDGNFNSGGTASDGAFSGSATPR